MSLVKSKSFKSYINEIKEQINNEIIDYTKFKELLSNKNIEKGSTYFFHSNYRLFREQSKAIILSIQQIFNTIRDSTKIYNLILEYCHYLFNNYTILIHIYNYINNYKLGTTKRKSKSNLEHNFYKYINTIKEEEYTKEIATFNDYDYYLLYKFNLNIHNNTDENVLNIDVSSISPEFLENYNLNNKDLETSLTQVFEILPSIRQPESIHSINVILINITTFIKCIIYNNITSNIIPFTVYMMNNILTVININLIDSEIKLTEKLNSTIETLNDTYKSSLKSIFKDLHKLIIIYNKLSDDIKENNINVNILLCELIFKYCYYLFHNCIIINDIMKFKSKSRAVSINLQKFYNSVDTNKNSNYTESIDTFIKYNNYIKKLFNNKIYLIDINSNISFVKIQFNIVFKSINRTNLLNFSLINETTNTNDIDLYIYNKSKYPLLDVVTIIISTIIYQIINSIYIKQKLSYVTIPQYTSNCWQIAMITGIAYSDLSKKLLLNSRETSYSEHIFNKFIYYIIDNVTNNFKKYDENVKSDCEIFKKFYDIQFPLIHDIIESNFDKSELNDMLKVIYYKCYKSQDYDKNIKEMKIYIDNNILIYSYFVILRVVFNKLMSKSVNPLTVRIDTEERFISTINRLIDNLSYDTDTYKYGIRTNHIYLLSYYYNLLNINNTFYYYKKEGDIYSVNPHINYFNENPDVLIFQNSNDISSSNINKRIIHEFKNIGNSEINFNEAKYKLDFIFLNNDFSYSTDNCGHSICAIHYNGKQYIYDTTHTLNRINCSGYDNDFKIPCSLIKQDWINLKGCYKSNQCTFIKIDKEQLKSERNRYESLCFSDKIDNTIYVYVKI